MQVDNNGSITNYVKGSTEQQATQKNQPAEHQNQHQESQQIRQSDTVTLTQAATQLHEVEQHIRSTPVTDIQRIEQVQSAINKGRYAPDLAEVADKMMHFESGLNTART